jgi:hypothetical protein
VTQGYLVEAIGYLLARIAERWPERVTREPPMMLPGTFVRLPTDVVWVGDHYTWDTWTVDDLKKIADRLNCAVRELEAA